MYLVYLDESGNTGCNLNDHEQPLFVLCALVVSEKQWRPLESDLQAAVNAHFGEEIDDTFELHATDLLSGRGFFKGKLLDSRLALRDQWLKVAQKHHVTVIFRAIEKPRFGEWVDRTFGSGIKLNPHVAAFALVASVVNDYLAQLSDTALGTFISDENVEVMRDVEKSLRSLRGMKGALQLNQIIEKGFFIDSRKSLPLQLCDLCALTIRKVEEEKLLGRPLRSVDKNGAVLIQPLVHQGNEKTQDVLRWLTDERKKEATRDTGSGVGEGPAHTGRY